MKSTARSLPATFDEVEVMPGQVTVIAVVVAFQPNITELQPLLAALVKQCSRVLIVDNSEPPMVFAMSFIDDGGFPDDTVRLVTLGRNVGLAAALNVGISCALDEGADFVLLSDQDSLPAEDMVSRLVGAYEELIAGAVKVAAVGPTFKDVHTGITFPFQVSLPEKFFYGHKHAAVGNSYVEALGLITSGTLIPAGVLHSVGLMREEYFIDKVDIEWCHRARACGYKVFGVGGALLYQRLGEAPLRVWYLGWRSESRYSPTRIYYQVRNFIAICRLDYIDWRWKIRNGWFTLGLFYANGVFGPRKLAALKMGLWGVLDGMRNKMGRCQH